MAAIQQGISTPLEVGRQTIQEFHFPTWLARGFYFIHKVHFLGRTWIRFQRRIESPSLYLGGAFLNQQLGDSTVIRVTAQIVLIARILVEAVEDGANIVRSWNAYTEVLEGTDDKTSSYLCEGLSTREWSREEGKVMGELFFSKQIAIMAHRIYVVTARLFQFLEAVFKLSYRMLELYDAILIDPYGRTVAIDDLLIELAALGDHVGGENRRLEKAIEMYRPMVNKTFELLHLNWTADGLTKKVQSLADGSTGIRKAYNRAEEVAQTAGQGVKAIAGGLFT